MPSTTRPARATNSAETADVKRRRTSSSQERGVDDASTGATDALPFRLIALKKSSEGTMSKKDRFGYVTTSPCTDNTSILVPQHILQKVPFYKSELETALSATGPDGIPTIKNAKIPDAGEEPFIKAIDFIGGTPLPAIDAPGAQDIETLKSLLAVYDVCIELQTEELEQAVLSHISDHQYPKLKSFVEFARQVYGDVGSKKRTVNSSIGKVIKLKLTVLLPRLLQEGEEKRVTAMGGVLSTELLEVIVKYYSGVANMKFEETE